MFQLLPRKRFVIQTPDALQTVMERFETHLEPPKVVRSAFDIYHGPYQGTVSKSGFKISRMPVGRANASIPEIKGRFETPSWGTIVHITMNLNPVIPIFVGVWMLLWYGGTLLMWSSGTLAIQLALPFWVLPLSFLVTLWLHFLNEVERSHKDLLRIIAKQRPKSPLALPLTLHIWHTIISLLGTVYFFWFLANN